MDQQVLVDENFPLFSKSHKPSKKPAAPIATATIAVATKDNNFDSQHLGNSDDTDLDSTNPSTFAELGLAEWAVKTCKELAMRKPRQVQLHCIPKILDGRHVLGIDETGSGKTAAFALPILHRLGEHPFGVFALVLTPTRELAYQLAEQFRALGSCLHVRIAVVVGGMDMLEQAKILTSRPHIVIATPGRIKVLLENNPDIPPVFSRSKFLVLDEADRVLDVGFQEDLKLIFQSLPESRQNLFFSATTTSNLQKLRDRYQDKLYVYEAYQGLKTVETLEQQIIFVPNKVKEVYLMHILSKMEDMGIRSAMVFFSTCRDCHRLSLMLEVLDQEAAALYSFKSQTQRLEALNQFKSGKVSILLATDVASRGLDIPTVDLVINYDVPRFPRDYVHRVGRTARAGRGGLAVSIGTQNDVRLILEVEAHIERQLELVTYKENEVLTLMKKVFSAKNVAEMKMLDDGFEAKAEERKKQKLKVLAEKGLLKKGSKKRKRNKVIKEEKKLEEVETLQDKTGSLNKKSKRGGELKFEKTVKVDNAANVNISLKNLWYEEKIGCMGKEQKQKLKNADGEGLRKLYIE